MSDDNSAWADELIRRARSAASPRAGQQQRVLEAVELRVGIAASRANDGGASGPEAATRAANGGRLGLRAPSSGSSAISLTRLQLLASVGSFGLATGALGYWWGSQSTPSRADAIAAPIELAAPPPSPAVPDEPMLSPPAQLEAPAPVFGTSSEPPAVAASSSAPRSTEVQRARPKSRAKPLRATVVPPPSAEPNTQPPLTLGEAIALLQRAQTALRQDEPREALALLSSLEERIPEQPVREELLVTRTLALCDLGDIEGARATKRELEREGPATIYDARLAASCVGTSFSDRQ